MGFTRLRVPTHILACAHFSLQHFLPVDISVALFSRADELHSMFAFSDMPDHRSQVLQPVI